MSTLTWRFIAEKDIASRAIAWFGGGSWSHIDVRNPDGTYTGAREDGGYIQRPADYIKPAHWCFFTLEVTAEQEVAFWKSSNAKLGDAYDKLAIWGFLLGRDWAEPGKWICSEAQAHNLTCAKIIHPLYLSANRITPNDMTLILSSIGGSWTKWDVAIPTQT